jgi:hypothetical protein
MSIIDSLKRLERAGSENSRATEKLRSAASDVAAAIEAISHDFRDVPLPRGYVVETYQGAPYLMSREQNDDDYYSVRYAFFGRRGEDPTRAAILEFAADIADGWLDELAEFLESRQVESNKAAEILEAAKVSTE